MLKTNFETQELRLTYFEWGTKKSAPAAGKESTEVDHYAYTPFKTFFCQTTHQKSALEQDQDNRLIQAAGLSGRIINYMRIFRHLYF